MHSFKIVVVISHSGGVNRVQRYLLDPGACQINQDAFCTPDTGPCCGCLYKFLDRWSRVDDIGRV